MHGDGEWRGQQRQHAAVGDRDLEFTRSCSDEHLADSFTAILRAIDLTAPSGFASSGACRRDAPTRHLGAARHGTAAHDVRDAGTTREWMALHSLTLA